MEKVERNLFGKGNMGTLFGELESKKKDPLCEKRVFFCMIRKELCFFSNNFEVDTHFVEFFVKIDLSGVIAKFFDMIFV